MLLSLYRAEDIEWLYQSLKGQITDIVGVGLILLAMIIGLSMMKPVFKYFVDLVLDRDRYLLEEFYQGAAAEMVSRGSGGNLMLPWWLYMPFGSSKWAIDAINAERKEALRAEAEENKKLLQRDKELYAAEQRALRKRERLYERRQSQEIREEYEERKRERQEEHNARMLKMRESSRQRNRVLDAALARYKSNIWADSRKKK